MVGVIKIDAFVLFCLWWFGSSVSGCGPTIKQLVLVEADTDQLKPATDLFPATPYYKVPA